LSQVSIPVLCAVREEIMEKPLRGFVTDLRTKSFLEDFHGLFVEHQACRDPVMSLFAPQEGVDPGAELAALNGFREENVGSRLKDVELDLMIIESGHDKDGRV